MTLTLERAWDGRWLESEVPEPDFSGLLGPAAWQRLHPDIRRRFSRRQWALPTIYDGGITLRRSPVGAVFALLCRAWGGPLPLRQCESASALVQVRGDGRGGLIWERWIRFPGPRRSACVRSTKRLGSDGSLLECVEGGLGMVLTVFEAEGALVFESRGYFLNIAGARLPLPALLTPGRCRVTHRAVGPARFEFSLRMDHPLLGQTFLQTGIFHDAELPP